MKYTFHIIGLPHTQTIKEKYLHCAYTQKVLNFCKMMYNLGHTVYHYGAEGSQPLCTEHVSIITQLQQEQWFHSNWEKGEFPDFEFDPTRQYWIKFNNETIKAISKRIQTHDFICIIGGHSQAQVANAFPNNISVEYGIGYEGTFAKFRCFESEAWRHHVYGLQQQRDGIWYDTVIPNYIDPIDFPLGERKGDYFLFLGRLILRKNPHVAAEVCKKIGAKLLIAGQGVTYKEQGKICSNEVIILGNHVEHVGIVGVKERAKLLGNAKALFVLTQYIAPFEGVHAEAGLTGCPVITTDWGVFPETVENGITGYRIHTMGEAMWAARNAHLLDPKIIREKSLAKFSINMVALKYQEWFDRLYGLYIKGKDWYDESPGRFM